MDLRPKYKYKNVKLPEKTIREKPGDLGFGEDILANHLKYMPHERVH